MKLFGTAARVKLMRLFLFSPDVTVDVDDIMMRTKTVPKEVKKELALLMSIGLVKRRVYFKEVVRKTKKKILVNKVKKTGYILESKFPYLHALKNLLTVASLDSGDEIIRKFSSVGRIKLLAVAGVFIQEWDSRVDLLIVADSISMSKVEHIMKQIEAELGKEISYTALDTAEFDYRLNIHDKLIRDILDSSHRILIDKIGLNDPMPKV